MQERYGINFGSGNIPAELKRMFRETVSLPPREHENVACGLECGHGHTHDKRGRIRYHGYDRDAVELCYIDHRKVEHLRLQGVARGADILRGMIIQASNGHRRIHTVAKGEWFGIYCS